MQYPSGMFGTTERYIMCHVMSCHVIYDMIYGMMRHHSLQYDMTNHAMI